MALNKTQYIYLQFRQCKQFIKICLATTEVVQNSSFPILKLVRKIEEIHIHFFALKAPGLMLLYGKIIWE